MRPDDKDMARLCEALVRVKRRARHDGLCRPRNGRRKAPSRHSLHSRLNTRSNACRQFHYDTDRLGTNLAARTDALRLLMHMTP